MLGLSRILMAAGIIMALSLGSISYAAEKTTEPAKAATPATNANEKKVDNKLEKKEEKKEKKAEHKAKKKKEKAEKKAAEEKKEAEHKAAKTTDEKKTGK